MWAADTWLHVSLSIQNIFQTTQSIPSGNNFGDQIPNACIGLFDTDSLILPSCGQFRDDDEPYKIMSDLSDRRQVLAGTDNNGGRFSFLAPVNPPRDLDFISSTFAANSSCQPISRRCSLEISNLMTSDGTAIESGGFKCSDNLYGNFTVNSTDLQAQYPTPCSDNGSGCFALFADSLLNTTIGHGNQYQDHNPNALTGRYANPFFAGVVGYVEAKGHTLLDSPDLIMPPVGGEWFILRCQITIFDLTYLWANSSLASNSLAPASDEVAAVVRKALGLPMTSAIS